MVTIITHTRTGSKHYSFFKNRVVAEAVLTRYEKELAELHGLISCATNADVDLNSIRRAYPVMVRDTVKFELETK